VYDRYAERPATKVYYKPLMELPPLDLNQKIGEYESLVLIRKRGWKPSKALNNKQKYSFIEEVPRRESPPPPTTSLQESDDTRIVYIIVHCIPIPVLLKATASETMIIALSLPRKDPISSVFKKLTNYF